MTDTEFTPGPWIVRRDSGGVRRLFAGDDGPQLATASVFANWMPVEQKKLAHETADANARLMAAAPKMYAALSAIIDDHDCGNWSEYKMEDARIALAEARGETQ